MRFKNVGAKNNLNRRLAFESERLIDMRQVHRQQGATPWLHIAERQGGVSEMKDVELSAAGSAAFPLEFLEREPKFSGARQTHYGAGGSSVDEDRDRMAA
jgi:hypothetical protein